MICWSLLKIFIGTLQGLYVTVHRFWPALAPLDVHSRYDLAECYAMSFYTMGQGNQVWARGSTFRVREKTEIGSPKAS
ncbi:MAG: hypothetical protein BA872_03500 [Desulfobacterales bacterium C00003060]|nr:MAG: hypothetical protein BA872_03500 [Desulfobacterales bacterium C00003060]